MKLPMKLYYAIFALISILLFESCSFVNNSITVSEKDNYITQADILKTQEALEPYLADLGYKIKDDEKGGTEISLGGSEEYIANMSNVYIMGKSGEVSHGLTTPNTYIDIMDWISNNTVSNNEFKQFMECLNIYFGEQYVIKSYDFLSDETYVWYDKENDSIVCAWYANKQIHIRWNYTPEISKNPQKDITNTVEYACDAGGCSNQGTFLIKGISGQTEHYCYEHYKEMQDLLDYMENNTKNSSNKYSGYSDTYQKDAKYRSNVKDIAEIYGLSEKDVDAKINSATGGK